MKIGLKTYIIILCVSVTAFVSITVLVISSISARETLKESTRKIITGYVEQSSERFNMMADNVKRLSVSISFDFAEYMMQSNELFTYEQLRSFRNVIDRIGTYTSANQYIWETHIYNFRQMKVINNSGMRDIERYTDHEQDRIVKLFEDEKYISRLKFMVIENRNVVINRKTKEVITFVFPVTNGTNSIIGCVVSYMLVDYVDHLCNEIAVNTNGYALLINRDGIILSSSDNFPDMQFNMIDLSLQKQDGQIMIHEENMLYSVYKTNLIDCSFICLVPIDILLKDNTAALRVNIIASSVIISLMTFVMILIFNRLFFRPIELMIEKVQKDIGSSPRSGLGDKIGNLLDELVNSMAHNQLLMKRLFHQQLIVKESRIKLLASQINPHFLYNSLDTMVWMLDFEQYDKAKKMIQCMAKFYRSSTMSESEWTTVLQEKTQIENYLYIQSIRYSDRLKFEIAFPEEILNHEILKFLLQPLVENAIHHGVENLEDSGLITITAKQVNKEMIFQIRDNGSGISADRLSEINNIISEPTPDEKGFYALHNIHWRIRLHYGEQYGLKIENIPTGGACVTICVPNKPLTKEDSNE